MMSRWEIQFMTQIKITQNLIESKSEMTEREKLLLQFITRRLPARAHFSVLLRFSIAHTSVSTKDPHENVWAEENHFHDWDIRLWEFSPKKYTSLYILKLYG